MCQNNYPHLAKNDLSNTQHQKVQLPRNEHYTAHTHIPHTPLNNQQPTILPLLTTQSHDAQHTQQPINTENTLYPPPVNNIQKEFISNEYSQEIINYIRSHCILSVESGHNVLVNPIHIQVIVVQQKILQYLTYFIT